MRNCDEITLDEGTVPISASTLHVDCTADGLARRPTRPVFDGDEIVICYYTSPPNRDYPWLMGMLTNSSIEMVRFKTEALEKLADEATR